MYDIPHIWNLKRNDTNELTYKTEETHKLREGTYGCQVGGGGGEGIVRKFGVELYTMLLLSHFSHVRLCATPDMAAHQAPPSMGLSRQEHWSGLPFPSPMHESEK